MKTLRYVTVLLGLSYCSTSASHACRISKILELRGVYKNPELKWEQYLHVIFTQTILTLRILTLRILTLRILTLRILTIRILTLTFQ